MRPRMSDNELQSHFQTRKKESDSDLIANNIQRQRQESLSCFISMSTGYRTTKDATTGQGAIITCT